MHRRFNVFSMVVAAAAAIFAASPAQAGCSVDVNGDEVVNVLDLLDVLTDWGPCPGCPTDVNGDDVVDVLDLLAVLSNWDKGCPELAGNALAEYPYFEYVLAFNEGEPVKVALDPGRFPDIAGQDCDIYIVEAKTAAEWTADPSLTDVTGGAQTETFSAGTIQDNTFTISGSASLSGDAGIGLGVAYDVVCDFNQNGVFDSGDYIDGLDDEVHGMYVVHDTTQPGPLDVTELTYTCPNWDGTSGYDDQNTFYPTDIASMGELPLVVITMGLGFHYLWYDHIGLHLASYGYVVVSAHTNDGAGTRYCAESAVEHTDIFLRELPNIGDGSMAGHVDPNRIIWIGHGRAGEGVAYAYDKLFDGEWTPENFGAEDIVLISSIAPLDFMGPDQSNPHGANFHVWVGSADSYTSGCAQSDLGQPFQLHDRAEGYRQSISVYGAGYGDFSDHDGSSMATGPCLIGRADTHKIMKGYLVPLVKRYTEDNVPAMDFLTRQWESFRPIGAPTGDCIVNDLMYRDGPAAGNFIIDDYQSEFDSTVSSSGGDVTYTVTTLTENRLDDGNTTFTHDVSDPMNGMTVGGSGDDTRGVVFEWNSDSHYELEIVGSERDLRDDAFLSFRACQATRHPNTIAELGDLTFTVTLRDSAGVTSSINIGAFGGGLEEPYQRTGCGSGTGWANEFETIRVRLKDFLNNGSGLDLADIAAVRFEFGSSYGSDLGRMGLDDVEFTKD